MSDDEKTFWACGLGWSANEYDSAATLCVIDIDEAMYQKIKIFQKQILAGLGAGIAHTSPNISIYYCGAEFFEYHLPVERNGGDWHYTDDALAAGTEAFVVEDEVDGNHTRTECARLVVSDDDIQFEAVPKCGRGIYHSFQIPIAELDGFFGADA